MQYVGGCHCGAIRVRFDSERPASELPIRLCGCSFCSKHRPRYTSDPAGHVAIELANEAAVSRYRFGLRLADFLICRVCGVFVAACEPGLAIINLDVLDDAGAFTAAPSQFTDYDREDAAQRSARRARVWTPAIVRGLA